MVRKARKKDIKSVKELIDYMAQKGKLLSRTRRELEQVIHHFYVCEVEGRIVGCCALEIYSKKLAEIRSLAVHTEHQKRRIGSQLIETCLKEARSKNIFEVLCVTDQVVFFEKKGFSKQLGPDQFPLFIKPHLQNERHD